MIRRSWVRILSIPEKLKIFEFRQRCHPHVVLRRKRTKKERKGENFQFLISQTNKGAPLVPRHSILEALLTASNCQHRNQGSTKSTKKQLQRCCAEQPLRLLIHSLLLLPQMHPNPSPILTTVSPDSWDSATFPALYPIVLLLGLWVLDGIVAARGDLAGLEWRASLFVLRRSHSRTPMSLLTLLRPSFSIAMVCSSPIFPWFFLIQNMESVWFLSMGHWFSGWNFWLWEKLVFTWAERSSRTWWSSLFVEFMGAVHNL